MLGLYRTTYRSWNVKHFHEHGVRDHGFRWGYTWTKTQLHAAGLVDRAPRTGAHRRKRERKPVEGMMLHQDGSRFAWLEGQPELDLIVTMDDATSTIYSAFLVEEEGTQSTFRACIEVFGGRGLPSTIYTDRGSHYFHTPEAGEAVDKDRLTQVGRGLRHLGIEHIPAYSPEARGRSERMFGTLQDRMAKELALAGIREVEEANLWIREVYLPDHNRLFAKPAREKGSAFVPVDHAVLAETLCIEEPRVVARDNTVGYERRRLQLPPSGGRAHFVKANVKVREYPDATLAVFHGPRCLARYTTTGEPFAAAQKKSAPEVIESPAGPSVAACSTASRRGLEAPVPGERAERRPTLTPSARAATRLPGRKGSTGAASAPVAT